MSRRAHRVCLAIKNNKNVFQPRRKKTTSHQDKTAKNVDVLTMTKLIITRKTSISQS
mgnify:FL=1